MLCDVKGAPGHTNKYTHKQKDSPYFPMFSGSLSPPPLPIVSHIFLGIVDQWCLCVFSPPEMSVYTDRCTDRSLYLSIWLCV